MEPVVANAINGGLPRSNAQIMMDAAIPKMETLKPGFVHILAGTNDVLVEEKFKTAGKVLKMAKAARNAGAQVVVIGTVPPVNRKLINQSPLHDFSRYNYLLWITAWANGFKLADYNTAMSLPDGEPKVELFNNAIHPNDAGYQVMNQVLSDVLGKDYKPWIPSPKTP